jgi:tetratricopeptide (TPR) repeat protein
MASAKEYKPALAETGEAIKLAPQLLAAYEMRVQLALAMGDATAAANESLEIQRQFPSSVAGFMQLGRVHETQKRFELALKQYEAASRVAPRSPEPVLAALALLVSQRKFAEAKARIEAIPESAFGPSLPAQLRGELAFAQSDYAKAESAFREVLRLRPRPKAYVNLAAVHVAQRNVQGALDTLAEGERAFAESTELTLGRGDLLVRARRYDDAVAAYESVLARAPDNEAAVNNLAYVLSDVKRDPSSLVRALTLASRFKNSSSPGNLDTLAMVHFRMGRYDQSVLYLERAVALSPKDPGLQLHLGMSLVKQGDKTRGGDLIRSALSGNAVLPNAVEARALLKLA